MKKLKVIFCLLLLAVVISLNVQVKAAEQLPDNGAKISSAQIIQTKTGTGPWDDDDEPGNDSSEDNNIVRSFDQVTWTIENTMSVTDGSEGYNGGTIYFEAKLPTDVLNSNIVEWDLSSMAWIENAKLSADKMTLTGYYSLNKNTITIPGKQTLVFVLKILGAPNGTDFTPEFKVWLNGNDTSEYVSVIADEIRISAAANYNLKLVRNTNCEARQTFNIDGNEIVGRVYGYALVYQLYNENTSKGLKGIEYPTGSITADIDISFTKRNAVTGVTTDITDEVTPIFYQYSVAKKSLTEGEIPGRQFYTKPGTNFAVYGDNIFPGGKAGNRSTCVLDTGNVVMSQNGSKLSVEISNYKFDGIFPTHNNNDRVTIDPPNYGKNIGNFGSIYFQLIVPDWEEYDNYDDYRLVLKDSNFHATSISGIETTTQIKNNDDSTSVQYVKTKPGTYQSLVYLHRDNNGSDGSMLHSFWNKADCIAQRGQTIWVTPNLEQNINNDDEAHMRSVNVFYKFDGDAVEPIISSSGKKFTYWTNDMRWNMWYVTKKDGTNWTSQAEMNSTVIDDCDIYSNIADIPEGKICVGVYWEENNEGVLIARNSYLHAPVRIKSDAVIGQTYAFTQNIKYWNYKIDRSKYTASKVIAGEETWPTDTVFDITDNYRNYIKLEYERHSCWWYLFWKHYTSNWC